MKTCFLLLLAFSSGGVSLGQLPYHPCRKVGDKYYNLAPIYAWVGQARANLEAGGRGVGLSNPDLLLNGWSGVRSPMPGERYVISYQVAQVLDNGIVLQERKSNSISGYEDLGDPFFVTNYPGFAKLVDKQIVGLLALRTGIYYYTDTQGAARSIPLYDYGVPCELLPKVPLTPEQIAAQAAMAKVNAERSRRLTEEGKTNALRWLQTQSTNGGGASAQYRLGLCYLTGSGCATNRAEALRWFKIAAAAGSEDASNKLATISP